MRIFIMLLFLSFAGPCCAEQSCVPAGERSGRRGNYFWKTREVSPADLQPGVVVARDKANDGPWSLARIIDASEAASGYLSVSTPGRVKMDSVRVVGH